MEFSSALTGETIRQRCREFDTVHDDAVEYFGGGFATYQNDFDSALLASGDSHHPNPPKPLRQSHEDAESLLSEQSLNGPSYPHKNYNARRPPRSPLPPSSFETNLIQTQRPGFVVDDRYHFIADRGDGILDLPFAPDPVKQGMATMNGNTDPSSSDHPNINKPQQLRHKYSSPHNHVSYEEPSPNDSTRSPLQYRQNHRRHRVLSMPVETTSNSTSMHLDAGIPHQGHGYPSGHAHHIVIDDVDEEDDIEDEDPVSASSASRAIAPIGKISPTPPPPQLRIHQEPDQSVTSLRPPAETFMSSSSANTTVTPGSPHQPSSPGFTSPPLRPIQHKRSSLPAHMTYYSDTERDRDRAESSASTIYASSANFPLHSYSASATMTSFTGSSADAHPIDWAAARAAYILRPTSERVRFEQFAVGLAKNTVLVFVTQKTIEVSALVYARVAHLLQQAGARIVFVSPWSPKQATEFLSQFERINPVSFCVPRTAQIAVDLFFAC